MSRHHSRVPSLSGARAARMRFFLAAHDRSHRTLCVTRCAVPVLDTACVRRGVWRVCRLG